MCINNSQTTFFYDADGQRVMTSRPGGVVVYTPFPDYEREVAADGTVTERTTYSIAGQMVAARSAGTLYYTYGDHLGSVVAMSNTAGDIIANSLTRYDPFGNYRTWPGSNVNPLISDRGFTGHVHDNTGVYPTQNVGLIYMNARYYLPEVGRFVSADTIVPNPSNPQSFNRYSYVHNSPMNFTDPTGHRECSPTNGGQCRPLNKPPKIPSGPTLKFEGEGWTEAGKTSGNVAANLSGNAHARILNENHFGWALSGEEAFKLTYGGSVTFSRTTVSCAQATGIATNDCWAQTMSRTQIDVYTNAGDVSGEEHWYIHEFAHAFEISVGDSIPSTTLQQIQDSNANFPNRVAGADGIVDADATWGFADTRWEWQQSASANANEELADMYLGWVYGQFEDSDDGVMRAGFMDNYMPLWVDLAVTR